MVLTSKDTKFLFVVTSTDHANPRFEYDIIIFIKNLIKASVSVDQMIIVSDEDKSYFESYGYPAGLDYCDSAAFINKVRNVDCKNLFLIYDCHGHYLCLPAKTQIKPAQVTHSLHDNVHVENVVALFGQCYAGAYNYELIESEHKNIVYIGATEMHSSISTPLALAKAPLAMNTFIVAALEWMLNPEDIDGDGATTVMDLYKYIGYRVNSVNSDVGQDEQKKLLTKILDLHEKKIEAKKKGSLTDDINKEADDAYNKMILTNQRPWILNARVAHSMIIQVK